MCPFASDILNKITCSAFDSTPYLGQQRLTFSVSLGCIFNLNIGVFGSRASLHNMLSGHK